MLSFESKIYPNIVSNLKLVAGNMQVKQTQTRGSTEREVIKKSYSFQIFRTLVWLFYKNESLRTISNRFLASLSVADVLVDLVIYPF